MFVKRRMFPLPVQGIIDNPRFIALPAAGRGMLMTLVLYYWQTECVPLPTKGSEIFCIIRAHTSTWATHKDVVMSIFNEVKPELDKYFQERKTRYAVLADIGDRGRGIQRLKALAGKQVTHGAREETAPAREANPTERPARPEERGARARVAPGKSG